jgi:hypothetical protein
VDTSNQYNQTSGACVLIAYAFICSELKALNDVDNAEELAFFKTT